MGYSSVLGISAETLSNSEMEIIAELKTDEDQINEGKFPKQTP